MVYQKDHDSLQNLEPKKGASAICKKTWLKNTNETKDQDSLQYNHNSMQKLSCVNRSVILEKLRSTCDLESLIQPPKLVESKAKLYKS